MPYEVQMLTSRNIWKNALADERDGDYHDRYFATREEANAALDEILVDLAAAREDGFCPGFMRDDFRVQLIKGLNHVSEGESTCIHAAM
jgi:hypothetical protein